MPHHIAYGEPRHVDPFDPLQPANGIAQPAHLRAAGDIDLVGIAANHHPAVLAEPGKEHLHLGRRGVLRFIKDHERIGERAPAHEGNRRNLDLAAGDPPFDLLGRHAIVQRIVNRAQIRIDLFLHIAGQEPQPLTRFNRRARQDQPLDRASDQLRHRLRHRDVGFAGACWPQCENHVLASQRAHIFDLHCTARNNRFLAGADHQPRRAIRARNNPFERGFGRHRDQRFDHAGIKLLPADQSLVHPLQHIAGARHWLGRSFDLHFVSARRDIDPQPILDLHQIGIKLAEQRAQNGRLVELQLAARPLGCNRARGYRAGVRRFMDADGFAGHALLSESSVGGASPDGIKIRFARGEARGGFYRWRIPIHNFVLCAIMAW